MIQEETFQPVPDQENINPNEETKSHHKEEPGKVIIRSFTQLFDEKRERLSQLSKSTKSEDLQSVSTKIGHQSSHNSDKKISDFELKSMKVKVNHKTCKIDEGQNESFWNLSKSGHLTSTSLDITTLKYYFIKIASNFQMSVMRDLDDILTVKTNVSSSFHCLLTMCLPFGQDKSVIQLERSKIGKGNRVKILHISGAEDQFSEFRRKFYFELWKNDVLNLSNFEVLNLICYINKNLIEEVHEDYEEGCRIIGSEIAKTDDEIEEIQNECIKKFKSSHSNMKQLIFNKENKMFQNKNIEKSRLNELMLERILLNIIPIWEFYLKLEMKPNKEFLEKKKKILKKNSVRKIFEDLEIEKQLLEEEFHTNKTSIFNLMSENKKLPYYEAVDVLDELNLTLSCTENIKIISKFSEKLNMCYSKTCQNAEQVLDMDNQLPLTIYCLITSKNSQLKPIVHFLYDYYAKEDEFESENRTLAALKAALEYVRKEWVIEELEKTAY